MPVARLEDVAQQLAWFTDQAVEITLEPDTGELTINNRHRAVPMPEVQDFIRQHRTEIRAILAVGSNPTCMRRLEFLHRIAMEEHGA